MAQLSGMLIYLVVLSGVHCTTLTQVEVYNCEELFVEFIVHYLHFRRSL